MSTVFVLVSANLSRLAQGTLDEVRDAAVERAQSSGHAVRVMTDRQFVNAKAEQAFQRHVDNVVVGEFNAQALTEAVAWLNANGYDKYSLVQKALRDEPLSTKQIAWLMGQYGAHQAAETARTRWATEMGLA